MNLHPSIHPTISIIMGANFISAVLVSVCLFHLDGVVGHGMMVDPPGRSSMWRYGYHTPVNYDDDGVFCGGISVQWDQHGGKCGECGDEFTPESSRPRPNENGGYYGKGIITKTYKSGEAITVGVMVTTNHLGTFQFSLCKLNNPKELETEECFDAHVLSLSDQSGDLYQLGKQKGLVEVNLTLPEITCDNCVLRWHYRTANNWGNCEDGTEGMGCGPQETFRSCADISIVN